MSGFAGDTGPEAGGLLADSTLRLVNRNFYMNRDFRNGGSNSRGINGALPAAQRKGYREEWAHGLRLNFSSGYTRGALGFGVDAHAYAGFKLDSGRGRTGTDLLPISNNGSLQANVPDQFGQAGAAAKVRLSSTTVRWGRMRTDAPVFYTNDGRLVPEIATGILVESGELDGLFVEAGHFTSYSFRNSSNSDDDLRTEYTGIGTQSFDYVGGRYDLTDAIRLSLYTTHAEDIWKQHYLNARHRTTLADERALIFDLQMYRTRSTGTELVGDIRNLAWSIAGALVTGGHEWRLAFQKMQGDSPFDYIGRNSIYLANSSQYSDFSAPGERSIGLRHKFDWTSLGMPGFTSRLSYVVGREIDGTHADATGAYAGLYGANGKHSEFNADLKYVFPAGRAKNLSVRLRQAIHYGNEDQGEGDIHQFRLIVEYPLDFL